MRRGHRRHVDQGVLHRGRLHFPGLGGGLVVRLERHHAGADQKPDWPAVSVQKHQPERAPRLDACDAAQGEYCYFQRRQRGCADFQVCEQAAGPAEGKIRVQVL
ncbi:UNVERIFIED_CONTAM: hypothetical protein ACS92_07775 [Bacillus cereus]